MAFRVRSALPPPGQPAPPSSSKRHPNPRGAGAGWGSGAGRGGTPAGARGAGAEGGGKAEKEPKGGAGAGEGGNRSRRREREPEPKRGAGAEGRGGKPEPEKGAGAGAGAGEGRRRRAERAAGPPPRGPAGKRRGRRSIPGGVRGGLARCGAGGQPWPLQQGWVAGKGGCAGCVPWGTLMGVLVLQEIREEPAVLGEPAQGETGAGGTCQEREKAALLDLGQPKQPSAKDYYLKKKKNVQRCSHSDGTHGIFIIYKIFSLLFLSRASFSGSLQPTLKIV